MKKVSVILVLLIFFFISKGQDVKIVEINENYKQESRFRPFNYIDRKFDLTTINKIAILKGKTTNSGKNTLDYLFSSFWIEANENGANSFSIDSTYSVLDTTYVVLSVYNLTSPQIELNRNLYPRNMIYIIGDIDKKSGKIRTCLLYTSEAETVV